MIEFIEWAKELENTTIKSYKQVDESKATDEAGNVSHIYVLYKCETDKGIMHFIVVKTDSSQTLMTATPALLKHFFPEYDQV